MVVLSAYIICILKTTCHILGDLNVLLHEDCNFKLFLLKNVEPKRRLKLHLSIVAKNSVSLRENGLIPVSFTKMQNPLICTEGFQNLFAGAKLVALRHVTWRKLYLEDLEKWPGAIFAGKFTWEHRHTYRSLNEIEAPIAPSFSLHKSRFLVTMPRENTGGRLNLHQGLGISKIRMCLT